MIFDIVYPTTGGPSHSAFEGGAEGIAARVPRREGRPPRCVRLFSPFRGWTLPHRSGTMPSPRLRVTRVRRQAEPGRAPVPLDMGSIARNRSTAGTAGRKPAAPTPAFASLCLCGESFPAAHSPLDMGSIARNRSTAGTSGRKPAAPTPAFASLRLCGEPVPGRAFSAGHGVHRFVSMSSAVQRAPTRRRSCGRRPANSRWTWGGSPGSQPPGLISTRAAAKSLRLSAETA